MQQKHDAGQAAAFPGFGHSAAERHGGMAAAAAGDPAALDGPEGEERADPGHGIGREVRPSSSPGGKTA